MKYVSGWNRIDIDPSGPLRQAIKVALEDRNITKAECLRRQGREPHHRHYLVLDAERRNLNQLLCRWLKDGLNYERIRITVELE